MCGIAFHWSKVGRPAERKCLSSMVRLLKHRGPDAEGILVQENLGFAHSRLKVLDLSDDANQPFSDGNDVLIFNGEIFNYREIRSQLDHYQYKTTSDTEVLFRALQSWDVAALDQLSGQFAFVFYSKARGTLLIARDHVGICPLYTFETDTDLYVSSEIRALLEIQKFSLNPQGVFDYFAYRYNIQNGVTLFDGIERFAPGHYRQIDLKSCRQMQKRYWRLQFRSDGGSSEELQDTFDRILDREISAQSIADVPVGIYLSGGIDSRALLFGFSKTISDINSFTIGFDRDDPDVKLVNGLEKEIHFKKNLIPFTPEIFGDIEDVVGSLEEPFGDLIIGANYLLPKQASKSLSVVLSGEGGDESFMGYDHQRAFMKMNWLGRLPLLGKLAGLALSLCPDRLLAMINSYPGQFGPEESMRIRNVYARVSSPVDSYIRLISLFDDTEIKKLFNNSFLSHAPEGPDYGTIRETFSCDRSVWQSVMRLEIEQLTLIVNLLKQDRFSMRFSIEGRVPLVSRSILDFAASLPVDELLSRVNKPYLLGYSHSPVLVKRPFSVFASPIYVKLLIDLMEKYANDESIGECGIISRESVNRISEGVRRGGMLAVKKAMALVVFMVWWRVFRGHIRH